MLRTDRLSISSKIQNVNNFKICWIQFMRHAREYGFVFFFYIDLIKPSLYVENKVRLLICNIIILIIKSSLFHIILNLYYLILISHYKCYSDLRTSISFSLQIHHSSHLTFWQMLDVGMPYHVILFQTEGTLTACYLYLYFTLW